MNVTIVKEAIEKTGSLRKAAKLLGKPHTSLQWCLKRAGMRVVTKTVSTIEPIPRPETPKGN